MREPITMKSIPTPHNGCETSLTRDTSRQAMLTSDQSLMSGRPISTVIASVISSQESAAGASPCDLPAGTMIDLFGQVHAPASPSQPPERARRPMTNVTCGLRGFLSSESGALQSSLESRLRRRLDGAGSMLFSLTWKQKATPAGRPYCQLAASVRPISETEFGSWPTPMAGTPAQKGYNEAGNTDSGRKTVALASWPTPNVPNGGRSISHAEMKGSTAYHNGKKVQVGLEAIAKLASWPTPRTSDTNGTGVHGTGGLDMRTAAQLPNWATPTAAENMGDLEKKAARRVKAKAKWGKKTGNGFGESMEEQAQYANWATPTARDYRSESATDNYNEKRWGHSRGKPLSAEATLAAWSTPMANERFRSPEFSEGRNPNMTELARLTDSGATPNGSTAQTESPGQLDPDHSRWVMGYNAGHLSCAPTETLSFLKSQRNSSQQPKP